MMYCANQMLATKFARATPMMPRLTHFTSRTVPRWGRGHTPDGLQERPPRGGPSESPEVGEVCPRDGSGAAGRLHEHRALINIGEPGPRHE
jgi:hypothetical protein